MLDLKCLTTLVLCYVEIYVAYYMYGLVYTYIWMNTHIFFVKYLFRILLCYGAVAQKLYMGKSNF